MKSFLNKAGVVIIIAALIFNLAACSKPSNIEGNSAADENVASAEKASISIGALNGPTGMGMVKLMRDAEENEAALDYDFTLLSSSDEMVGKIISGEVDVAAVPTNLAMVLYNKTEGQIQLAAVNTLGVLYLLENGSSVQNIQDLRDRTVYSSGKGAMPDFVFQYLLKENQLQQDKDVMVDFKLQHAELAAALSAGDVELALLPQPHVTTAMMKNPDIRIALDITEEWRNAANNTGELAMGAIIVQREFAENNKEALDAFLEEYKASVDFVNDNMEEAGELIAKYGILPNAAVAKNAIPYSNIVYIDAEEAKGFLEELYQVLYSFEPKAIGGRLSDEGFYYKK